MTQLLVIAFRKQFAGKAYLKINLLVKTPLHRRSMEVRRSGLWAPAGEKSLGAKERTNNGASGGVGASRGALH